MVASKDIVGEAKIVTAIFFFFLVLYVVTHYVSLQFSTVYKKLDAAKRSYWCTTVCAILQSTTTTLLCIPIFQKNYQSVWSATTFGDLYGGLEWPLRLFLAHTASDFVWVAVYFKGSGDEVGFVVHHVAIIWVWGSIILNDFGHSFALIAMLCEATQPFIGFKWFFDQYDMRSRFLDIKMCPAIVFTHNVFPQPLVHYQWPGCVFAVVVPAHLRLHGIPRGQVHRALARGGRGRLPCLPLLACRGRPPGMHQRCTFCHHHRVVVVGAVVHIMR